MTPIPTEAPIPPTLSLPLPLLFDVIAVPAAFIFMVVHTVDERKTDSGERWYESKLSESCSGSAVPTIVWDKIRARQVGTTGYGMWAYDKKYV